jgi:hypothetical protein
MERLSHNKLTKTPYFTYDNDKIIHLLKLLLEHYELKEDCQQQVKDNLFKKYYLHTNNTLEPTEFMILSNSNLLILESNLNIKDINTVLKLFEVCYDKSYQQFRLWYTLTILNYRNIFINDENIQQLCELDLEMWIACLDLLSDLDIIKADNENELYNIVNNDMFFGDNNVMYHTLPDYLPFNNYLDKTKEVKQRVFSISDIIKLLPTLENEYIFK